MANPRHLKILEQGVEAWNEWREKKPKIEPDLGMPPDSITEHWPGGGHQRPNSSRVPAGTSDFATVNLSEEHKRPESGVAAMFAYSYLQLSVSTLGLTTESQRTQRTQRG